MFNQLDVHHTSIQDQKNVLRPYIEQLPDERICPLCKDRELSIYQNKRSREICGPCYSKLSNKHPDKNMWRFIFEVCSVTEKSLDISQIRAGESICGTVIYADEETPYTPKEHICNLSETGLYFHNFDMRWIIAELETGFLVSEMNTAIGFVINNSDIDEEDVTESDFIPSYMKDSHDYTILNPRTEFSDEITRSDLLANRV